MTAPTKELSLVTEHKRTLAAVGMLIALVLAYCWQAFYPDRTIMPLDLLRCTLPWSRVLTCFPVYNPLISDKIRYTYPLNHFVASAVRNGEIPLWDPHIYSGFPVAGIGESQIFYPLSLIYYLWDNDPKAGDISIVVHLLIAALGGYALLRELGARRGPAMLAGSAYAFNVVVSAVLVWNGHLATLVWWPLVTAALERAMRTRRAGWTVVAGALAGLMLLSGHPERILHLMMVTGPFVLVRAVLLGRRESGIARWRPLAHGIAAIAIGTSLAAVKLWPEMELIALGSRVARTPDELAAMLLRYQPLTFLVPKLYGDPIANNYWWFDSNYNDTTYYFGLIPLFMACMLPWLRRDAIAWLFFGMMVVGAVLPWLMIPLRMVVAVPGLAHGLPYRLPMISVAAGSVAGALALNTRLGGLRPPVWWVASVAGVMALAVLARVLEYWDAMVYRGEYVAVQLALFAVFLAISIWLARAQVRPQLLAGVGVAAVVVDLFIAGASYNNAQRLRNKLYPPTPSIEFLREAQSESPSRYVSPDPGVFPSNMGVVYGLDEFHGLMNTVDRRYARLLAGARVDQRWTEPATARLLSLFNVRHVLTAAPVEPAPGSPFRLVFDEDLTVYENTAVFPRAFIVHAQRVAAGEDQALAWLLDDATLDLRRVAISEAGHAPPDELGEDAPSDQAVVSAHSLNEVDVATHTASPGLLVLAESWYPGWQATVDGQPVQIWRVNYVQRGVVVPAGDHRVQFVFRPLSVYGGAAISGLTLAGCVAVLLWTLRAKSQVKRVPLAV